VSGARRAARAAATATAGQADLGDLLGDEEAVVEIGDDDRRFEQRIGQRSQGFLERGSLAQKANELLGKRIARFGPHTGAGAAAHDYGKNLRHEPRLDKCGSVLAAPKVLN
jgi:hypothetical protein